MKISSSWKQFERRAAELFGGVRNAFSGAAPALTGSRADVRHPYLYVEAKYRRKPAIARLWASVCAKADAEHKIPVVALAEHGKRGCWIVLHSEDLDRLSRVGDYSDLPLFGKGL